MDSNVTPKASDLQPGNLETRPKQHPDPWPTHPLDAVRTNEEGGKRRKLSTVENQTDRTPALVSEFCVRMCPESSENSNLDTLRAKYLRALPCCNWVYSISANGGKGFRESTWRTTRRNRNSSHGNHLATRDDFAPPYGNPPLAPKNTKLHSLNTYAPADHTGGH